MNYELRRLGDVAEIVGGGTPSTKRSEFWGGEIPWLTPKDLSSFDGIYVEEGSRGITSEGLKASSAKMLPPGSVLYTSRAPIGYVAIARNSIATNQGFKSFVVKEGYIPEYLFYLLKASTAEIESHASGGTFAEISAKAIADVELPFPPFEHQRAISSLLSSLDLKMEINRSVSKTLEALVQALFKSWFIDFDPVKAKMAGEAPVGMDAETSALFSTSIREAPEGLIPLDWEWGAVGEIADVVDCLHSKKPALIDEGKPFLQLNTIADDGILRYELAACVSDEDYSKWTSRIEVSSGDCVVTNVGRVGAVSQIPAHFKAAIGRNMTAVRPRDKGEISSFLFAALTSDFMRGEIVANTDSGTILDALNVKNIPWLKIPMPPMALIRKFEEIAGPMIRLRHELHRENVTLSSTRDALLPRLISGELQILDEMLAE